MERNLLNKPFKAFKIANRFVKELNSEIDKLDIKDDYEINNQFWETMSDKIEEIILLSFREGKSLAHSVIGNILYNIDFDDPGWSIDDIMDELEKKIS